MCSKWQISCQVLCICWLKHNNPVNYYYWFTGQGSSFQFSGLRDEIKRMGEGQLWHFSKFWHSVTQLFSISLLSFYQSIKIWLGVYQLSIKNKKEQIRNYSLTVPYPGFNALSLENDLMMIKLSKATALNTHVGTVAKELEPLASNDSCFIPTWTWNQYKNHLWFCVLHPKEVWSWGKCRGMYFN